MKYVYTPVLFTEIAKGLENKELRASNVYFETDKFDGVRSLTDTKLDLEDCAKTIFYLKKEYSAPTARTDLTQKKRRRRT
ncbi:hypothetical protein IGJ48_001236 [Enterococcus pernyi]